MPENNNQIQPPNIEGEKMKMPENTDAQMNTEEKDSIINGPLLIILALLLVAVLAGMYYWYTTIVANQANTAPTPVAERPSAEENNEPESTTAEAQVQTTQTMSSSDEIRAIEADLESTNVSNVDTEINSVEAEIESAIR